MRFYFDVHDEIYSAVDNDGTTLLQLEDARKKANDIATAIARDVFDANGSKLSVTVRDQSKILFVMTISLIIEEP
jgi:hypothetical protein